MEIFLRLLAGIVALLSIVINTILNWFLPRIRPTYPAIKNKLLTKPISELVLELQKKKITSVELVHAYIDRIKEVNASLNAVIEDRFEHALKEAQHADQLIARSTNEQLFALYVRHPLLGLPFTVKESCGLKDLSFTVGNINRLREKCPQNGDVVELLRSAGCIPLLVSANPEFCLSFETNTHTHGKCLNPYDQRRSCAGSSGGEGALNGSGASLFGLGSDIAGSIRMPALFCGVFGHKPTGGLVSVKGHFPYSQVDQNFPNYLQLGPITRFARDLPILLNIMAGSNAEKLNFTKITQTKDIKIYYTFGFSGLNQLLHQPLEFDMKLALMRAVKCFEKGGLTTKEVKIENFRNSMEMCLSGIINIDGIPSVVTQSSLAKPKTKSLAFELIRSFIGHSLYTKEAIFIEFMQSVNAFIPRKNVGKIRADLDALKQELMQLLGTNGVLFLPTFHTAATHFHTSILNATGIDLMAIFNMLGFPATHIPMGLNSKGLPVGFQVVAAPYQDKLCLQIAAELEGAFGGWVPPLEHNFSI